MNCKTCIGCQRQEEKDFKEVEQCIYYKSVFQELEDRVEEYHRNVEKYQQIKV